jgi:hypothetical protein
MGYGTESQLLQGFLREAALLIGADAFSDLAKCLCDAIEAGFIEIDFLSDRLNRKALFVVAAE